MRAWLNPFGCARVDALRLPLDERHRSELLKTWESLGRRACVVGPQGTGKTVFLEDFTVALDESGEEVDILRLQDRFLREDADRVRGWIREYAGRPDAVLVLDGGEILPRPFLRWILRRLPPSCGFLLTLHQLRRCPLPIIWETRPRPLLARRLVSLLLERPLSPEEVALVDQRFKAMDGNIRLVLRAFYLDYAHLPDPEPYPVGANR